MTTTSEAPRTAYWSRLRIRLRVAAAFVRVALALALCVGSAGARERAAVLKVPQRTLIKPDANTVTHLRWDGAALVDIRGSGWVMQGTVPQVTSAPPVPPGAGPYAAGNYYKLGTGTDALDFAGDFSLCFVFKPTALTSAPELFTNAAGTSAGYYVWVDALGGTSLRTFPSKTVTASGASTAAVNVACVGRSGTSIVAKQNLGALSTTTGTTITPDTTTAALLGKISGAPFTGVIYEVWASTTTPTDALFTDIQSKIKTKLGISAW